MVSRRIVVGTLGAGAVISGALIANTAVLLAPASAVGATSGRSLTLETEHVAKIGTVLATSTGRTLYRYAADPAGQVTCTAACAKIWAPMVLPKGVTHVSAPHAVKGLSVAHVAHGRLQVFFHHQALYAFASDTKKGVATGQGIENVWFAVLADGKPSGPASVSTPTTAGAPGPTTSTASTTPTTVPPAPAPAPAAKSTTTPPASTTPATTTPPPTKSLTTTPTTTPPPTPPPPTTTPPTTPPPPSTTTTPPPPSTTTTTTGYGY